ncbi:MAG: DUF6327 family protein [Maribacter sp.]|nr:DUF6327 family protein [Maribacter sp.]
MMAKKYNSFEEIDYDLKILRLNQDIDLENLKLNYHLARQSFYPTQLLGGFSGIVQKIVLSFLVNKLLKKFR